MNDADRSSEHPGLFRPGRIGTLELENRLIMAPMGNALADGSGRVTDRMIAYYRARAGGGVALVMTQFCSVTPREVMPYSLSLCDDGFIPSVRTLAAALQDCGPRVSVQLMHPGMLLLLLRSLPPGTTIKVPSITPWMIGERPYETIGEERIAGYVDDFARAARRVRDAGADAVDIHACHGCLLSSFLSPATNRRDDDFGGTPENRARFVRLVVEEVRRAVGPDFPVTVRINGADGVAGGVTADEVVAQARIVRRAGADAVGISSGLEYWSSLMAPCSLTRDAVNAPVSEKVREAVGPPVIVAAKIPPEKAAGLVERGEADFVALGRPFLADPRLAAKMRGIGDGTRSADGSRGANGNRSDGERPIRPCLYCNNCLRTRWRSCTVNPLLYREEKAAAFETPGLYGVETPKRIAVVGGGVAGMQAASLLGRRGHRVTLFERGEQLGGRWLLACRLPGRERFRLLLDYLERGLEEGGVIVRMAEEVTTALLREARPEVVVLATGASARVPDIPGADGVSVVQACDVIAGKSKCGETAAVIGGGTIAMETALLLAGSGCGVRLLSPGRLGGRRGPEERITFRALMERIAAAGIPAAGRQEILELTGEGVVVEREGEPHLVPASSVVLASGFTPDDRLSRKLEPTGGSNGGDVLFPAGVEIHSVGDCVQPGTAAQATYAAVTLAMRL